MSSSEPAQNPLDPLEIVKRRAAGLPVEQPAQTKPKLPVPFEVALKSDFERYGIPPLPGGLLDQPHILMICFDIIDEERIKWREEQERVKAANKRLQEAANAQSKKSRNP